MSCARYTQLVTELSAHPGLGPLASLVYALAQRACREGDFVFPRPGAVTFRNVNPPPRELCLVGEVDMSVVLDRGAVTPAELDLVTVLTLLGAAGAWPTRTEERDAIARCLLRLETFAGLRCLTACMSVFDSELQRQLAESLITLLEATDSELHAAESAIARAWLMDLSQASFSELGNRVTKLGASPPLRVTGNHGIMGSLAPKPRHPAVLTLLAITGILFLTRAARGLARFVLRRRTAANVWLSARGLELFCRQEMLGRVLRERRLVVPLEDIRSVEREVRFPRFGLYAGLIALALGTLLGTRLFVDGLRVAGLSFPLMAIGLLCIVLGVMFDMMLSGLSDSLRGRCRLVVIPRKGDGWAIGDLEPAAVDRLLTELSTQLGGARTSP